MNRSNDSVPAGSALPLDPGGSPTRARILQAGLDLFGASGYHATSIRDIASAAGIRSASLYSHFASKEAILAALVLVGHEVHHRVLSNALIDCGGDARDQLAALARAHVTVHCRYPSLAAVMVSEGRHLDAGMAAPAFALRAASHHLATEVIRRGIAQGVFRLNDAEVTQAAIGSLGVAASLWFPARADTLSAERVGAVYAELALRMVGAVERGPAPPP